MVSRHDQIPLHMKQMMRLTIQLRTSMNDTPSRVSKHRMADTIFLTEKRLVMPPFLDIVHLHAIVTFRSEKEAAFIVEI